MGSHKSNENDDSNDSGRPPSKNGHEKQLSALQRSKGSSKVKTSIPKRIKLPNKTLEMDAMKKLVELEWHELVWIENGDVEEKCRFPFQEKRLTESCPTACEEGSATAVSCGGHYVVKNGESFLLMEREDDNLVPVELRGRNDGGLFRIAGRLHAGKGEVGIFEKSTELAQNESSSESADDLIQWVCQSTAMYRFSIPNKRSDPGNSSTPLGSETSTRLTVKKILNLPDSLQRPSYQAAGLDSQTLDTERGRKRRYLELS